MAGFPATVRTAIEFPPFRLDLTAERLFRDDRPIRLRPKTWAVLHHLVGRRGFLVTRAELLDSVWQGAAVSDDNLTQSIAEIRQALGESARKPRFVETVHGRGFRFLAAVADSRRNGGSEPLDLAPSGAAFVGRAAEISRLTELLRSVEAGQRRVVFVTGEAGIGKTTLVDAFLATARRERSDIRIARGQSIEQYGLREPYSPVLEALERLVRSSDGEEVVSVVRRTAPSWAERIIPFTGEPRSPTPSVLPDRMLREIATALEELAADRALILVLEDLHWSDRSTIDFMTRLAERSEPARLLLIGTYRPAEASVLDHPVGRAKSTLEARNRAIELPLNDLSEGDVAEYVATRFPKAESASQLSRWLYRRSDGNPFLMGALADQLVASGDSRPPSEKEPRSIPRSLQDLIEISLARLDVDARRVLEAASAAGVRFDARAVASAVDLRVIEVEAICEDLVRRWGILRRLQARDWPDGTICGRYGFRHSLYQEVLYGRLSPAARRELHVGIGRRLESGFAGREAEVETELALHFERGGDAARAVDYLERAAARALALAAFREACDSARAAMQVLHENPDLPDHPRRELGLLRILAAALSSMLQFGSEELVHVMHRSLELCAALGIRSALCETHYSLVLFHILRGNREHAEQHAGALQETARGLGKKYRLLANLGSGSTALWSGNPKSTREMLEPVVALIDAAEPGAFEGLTNFGPNPVAEAYSFLAYALWLLGFPDRAVVIQEKGLAQAEKLGDPFTVGATLMHGAYMRLLRRDTDVVATLSRRLLELSTEYAMPAWKSVALLQLSWSKLRIHGGREALVGIRQGAGEWFTLGSKLTSPHYAIVAESCLEVGEITEGLAAVSEGFAAIAPTLDRFAEAELWRLKGELILAQRSRTRSQTRRTVGSNDAEKCLKRALEIARAQGARAFELRALTSLAKLEQRNGVAAEAHEGLSQLLGGWTEGFQTVDALAAKAVLAASK